jgi:hypothetical protein
MGIKVRRMLPKLTIDHIVKGENTMIQKSHLETVDEDLVVIILLTQKIFELKLGYHIDLIKIEYWQDHLEHPETCFRIILPKVEHEHITIKEFEFLIVWEREQKYISCWQVLYDGINSSLKLFSKFRISDNKPDTITDSILHSIKLAKEKSQSITNEAQSKNIEVLDILNAYLAS